jgi:hypothetical protein
MDAVVQELKIANDQQFQEILSLQQELDHAKH